MRLVKLQKIWLRCLRIRTPSQHVNLVFMHEDPVSRFIVVVIAWETLFTQAVDTKTPLAQFSRPTACCGQWVQFSIWSQMAPPGGAGGNKTWGTDI